MNDIISAEIAKRRYLIGVSVLAMMACAAAGALPLVGLCAARAAWDAHALHKARELRPFAEASKG